MSKKKEQVFAVRLFIDNKRIKSHKLTKRQAKIFRKAAQHLSRYLKKEYLS